MKTFAGVLVLILIAGGAYYLISRNKSQNSQTPEQRQNTSGSTTDQTQTPAPTPAEAPTPAPTNVSDHPVATIETSLGTFKITLDHTAAPKTVENFVKLANDKFYEGLKFHRVIQDFVIQGGDPNSKDKDPSTWGFGGPSYTIPAEIKLTAKVGAIGMASTAAKGPSNGSQFFVVTKESQNNHLALDGNYTLFGYVTSGMDVVTKISAVPTDPTNDMPLSEVTIKKITIQE
jgi:cyclophilin family peptidyl-prolyl cis-trans isomerase